MGFERALAVFQDTMGIPPALTVFVMFTKLAGAAGVLLGLLTRVVSLGLLGVMVVAPFANHFYPRFFMNEFGRRGGEGYEYHLLAIALLLILLVHGSGALSADRLPARERAASAGGA